MQSLRVCLIGLPPRGTISTDGDHVDDATGLPFTLDAWILKKVFLGFASDEGGWDLFDRRELREQLRTCDLITDEECARIEETEKEEFARYRLVEMEDDDWTSSDDDEDEEEEEGEEVEEDHLDQ